MLRVYYHLRGVKLSDHKKKKVLIHRPKSSQVVPLNIVTEVESYEEADVKHDQKKQPKTVRNNKNNETVPL